MKIRKVSERLFNIINELSNDSEFRFSLNLSEFLDNDAITNQILFDNELLNIVLNQIIDDYKDDNIIYNEIIDLLNNVKLTN